MSKKMSEIKALITKLDTFFDGKYVSLDMCDVFYKVTRGFLNVNEEACVGVGFYPRGKDRLTIHFLKFNAKGDKIKIDSKRDLIICPTTDCLLKNAIGLAKTMESSAEKNSDYIQ